MCHKKPKLDQYINSALFHLKLQVGLAKRNPAFGYSAPKQSMPFPYAENPPPPAGNAVDLEPIRKPLKPVFKPGKNRSSEHRETGFRIDS